MKTLIKILFILSLYLLIPFGMQSQSCSACMGYSQEDPDEFVEVLIRYNEKDEPVIEQAARYGETVVYSGDIVLIDDYSSQKALKGTIVSNLSLRWANNTIPYVFDAGLPQTTRTVILNAIETINAQTNLCVVERTNEVDFIRFQDSDSGCYVWGVGNLGGNQLVNLGSGCVYESVIIHEILHKAGLFHEQVRPDRDNYITVNWNNLAPGWASQFTAYGGEQISGNYDFASIMHYPQYHPSITLDNSQPAFYINGGVTVPPGISIGNMSNMSAIDIAAVNELYSNTCGSNNIQTGKVNVTTSNSGDWDQINFPYAFNIAPIVVVGPPSFAGTNRSTVRVRNVSKTGFQVQIDEWDYLDGGHVTEQLSYIAVKPGTYNLGGVTMKAGSAGNVNHTFKTVNFPGSFGSTPVVMTSQVTSSGGQATCVRLQNISKNSFQIRVQEEEGNDGTHVNETLHYIGFTNGIGNINGNTIRVGNTGNNVDHNWYTINFGGSYSNARFLASIQSFIGADPMVLRYRNLGNNSVQIKGEEEKSKDTETWHYPEIIGYVVIGNTGGNKIISETGESDVANKTLESDYDRDLQINNYPNPFGGQTTIEFTLSEESPVTLFVSDMNGKKIAAFLNNETQIKGTHQVIFDGSDYPAGMYYYTIQTGEHVQTQKMILAK